MKETKEIFAMKVISKERMHFKKRFNFIRLERDALIASNDWMVKLFYSFQNDHFFYFVLEYCAGGALHEIMKTYTLTFSQVKFVMAEIATAVDSLHVKGFIHNDLN